MLHQQLSKTGSFLFRWRSFLPLVMIPVGFLALHTSHFAFETAPAWLEAAWHGLCLLISFSGFALRIWIVGTTPPGTSGRNTKEQRADVLNTMGAYSLMRHPLYVGNFLMMVGIVLYLQSWWFLSLFVALYVLYYERIVMAEETFLRGKFGEAYEIWSQKVPAFFASFQNYEPSPIAFQWKKVLRKEYPGLAAMTFFFVMFEVVIDYLAEGVWELEPGWQFFILIGFGGSAILWVLKKFTHALDIKS